MGIPSSQVCAAWVKQDLASAEWGRLSDACYRAIRARVPTWTDAAVHEYVETNLFYVAEHLRDEASEWRIDGKAPQFEIDQEQSPYIRASPSEARPLLRHLRNIDPFRFETLCALILNKLGADGKATQKTADGGVDFEAFGLQIVRGTLGVPSACNAAVIGQAKRYKENPVRETEVREFIGAALLRRHELQTQQKLTPLAPVLLAYWTTSDFDQNAKRFARAMGLWYMDGDTLSNYVYQLGLADELIP